ncbi:cutinase family protein [Rhodococcus sp. ACT016]|uniref:RCC1 domain-containing protein n=1 Tax=Rhodococcus sp. ACT016 TaxID=3134808 RepID=UPI003D2B1C5D
MLRTKVFARPSWSYLVTVVIAILVVSGAVTPPGTVAPAGAAPVTTTAAAASGGATALTAGGSHTCALMSGGTAKCWGLNDHGQMGDGTTTDRLTPVAVAGLSGATAITAGWNHTCALMPGGTAKCWGLNDHGQMGDGTTTDRLTPVAVAGLSGATAITAGWNHTCALMPGGTAKCWGYNWYGQLGNATGGADRSTPTDVPGLSGATDLAAGGDHTCALMPGGTAKCWGSNEHRQLGTGTGSNTGSSTPVDVEALAGATALAAGGYHTCALMPGGTAKCWGNAVQGQIGNGTTGHYAAPTDVVDLSGATAITANTLQTCALAPGGTAKCWGYNSNGQLGNGYADSWTPFPGDVVGLAGATAITAGYLHTCALMSDRTAECWGYNSSGQLGDGTTTDRTTPVSVVGLTEGTNPDPDTGGGPGTNPATCSDTYFVGVRGSDEPPRARESAGPSLEQYEASLPADPVYTKGTGADSTGMGEPVTAVFEELAYQAAKYAPSAKPKPRAIAYPAIPVGDGGVDAYIDRYQRSVGIGADQLARALRDIQWECNNASVVLAGYSQGADVINKAMGNAQRGGNHTFDQVRKIVLIGDPSHRPDRPENVGAFWKLGSTNGAGVSVGARIADAQATEFMNANPDLVRSICMIGDFVCDTSTADGLNALLLGTGHPNAHTLYPAMSIQCPVVNDAWQYTTTCGGQILFSGLGHTPHARNEGGLTGDQVVVNVASHVWAVVSTTVGGAVGAVGNALKTLHGSFWSNPIDLGTFPVDENGTAVIDFTVPNVPAGEHHLELRGDDGRVYRIPIYVTDEPLGDHAPIIAIDQTSMETPPTTGPGTPTGSGSTGSTGSSSGQGSPFGS